MIKKIIAILLVFSMCFVLFACDGKKPDDETTTKEYVLPTEIIDSDVTLPYMSTDALDPYTAKSQLNRDLLSVIYEGLFTVTDDGHGKSMLAESGTVDGTKITVKLNKGVKFSDGSGLSAKDVKVSFEKAKNSSFYKTDLSNVASVTVVDEHTLTFNLYKNDPFALNVLNFPVAKAVGKKYIGSGKYTVEKHDAVVYFSVNTAHRDYKASWNKQIALYDMAGITSPVYPFKANEISVYKQDLSKGEYINLSSQTVSEKMNNLIYVGVNSEWAGSITSLPWVRQAINIGINRSGITASSFLGQGTPVVTPFKTEFYQLNHENLPDIGGETERAVGILERNGYASVNSEGLRTDGSRTLSLDILVCSENQYKLTVAKSVEKSLEELGFAVTITEKKTRESFVEALEDGHFCLYIGETVLPSHYDLSEFFTKSGNVNYGISEDFYQEYTDYRNGDITTMTFVESFSTNVPFIPLYYRKTVVSVNPNITGANDGYDCYDNICNWKLKNDD